jgi:polyphosphate kinase
MQLRAHFNTGNNNSNTINFYDDSGYILCETTEILPGIVGALSGLMGAVVSLHDGYKNGRKRRGF